MDIYLIWATDGEPYNAYWLVGAWDEDSVSENFEGYQTELAKHRKDHGPDNVRVVRARIDFDKVTAAFAPPSVGDLTVQED